MDYKTPFSDAIEKTPVPHKGTSGGKYDSEEISGVPGRDGGLIPELHRDTHWDGPKKSGPIKDSPFKDAI